LLKNGADINVTNCEGKTALMLASDPQVINLLKKHKQNVKDSCDNDSDYFVDDNDVEDSD
jgi:ankyrin repeat protein